MACRASRLPIGPVRHDAAGQYLQHCRQRLSSTGPPRSRRSGVYHNPGYFAYTLSWNGAEFLLTPTASSQIKGVIHISEGELQNSIYATMGTATVYSPDGTQYKIDGHLGGMNVGANNQWGEVFTQFLSGFSAGYWGSTWANHPGSAPAVNLSQSWNQDPSYAFGGVPAGYTTTPIMALPSPTTTTPSCSSRTRIPMGRAIRTICRRPSPTTDRSCRCGPLPPTSARSTSPSLPTATPPPGTARRRSTIISAAPDATPARSPRPTVCTLSSTSLTGPWWRLTTRPSPSLSPMGHRGVHRALPRAVHIRTGHSTTRHLTPPRSRGVPGSITLTNLPAADNGVNLYQITIGAGAKRKPSTSMRRPIRPPVQ